MTTHSEILQHYNIVPKKSLGQNFLVQDGILRAIAGAIKLIGEDILEVWPGYWALTAMILERAPASLTLIEYDLLMIDILRDRIGRGDFGVAERLDADGFLWQIGPTRLTLHKEDILRYIPTMSMKVIANIPYYITSPILFKLLYEVEYLATEIIVLMQQEVGDKIRETRGHKASYLSTALQSVCTSITEVMRVSAANFIPPPRVESSVLHFIRQPERDIIREQAFLRVLWAGYLHPRKLLASNLSEWLGIDKSKILTIMWELWHLPTARAGELVQDQWSELTTRVNSIM